MICDGRPPKRDSSIDGLFFVGASTGHESPASLTVCHYNLHSMYNPQCSNLPVGAKMTSLSRFLPT
jgi:hypothetical protein